MEAITNMEERNALRKWLLNYDWINPFAITLTFKQRVNNIALDKYIAQNQVKNFITRISTKIFGNHFKRRNQNLNRISTMETTGRLHTHMFLDLPEYKLSEATNLIKDNWNPEILDWAYKQTDTEVINKQHGTEIERVNSQKGWLFYITKFKSRNDELDLTNTFLGQSNKHRIGQVN